MNLGRKGTLLALLVLMGVIAEPLIGAQDLKPNYDESKVPHYTLPDPLVLQDGTLITRDTQWWSRRRKEILRQFEINVFAQAPGRPRDMDFIERDISKDALGGKAIRKQVSIFFLKGRAGPHLDLLIYLPRMSSLTSPKKHPHQPLFPHQKRYQHHPLHHHLNL